MGFWSLLEAASMPVLQFLLIGLLGAFLSSAYLNILTADARRDINKIVFYVFTPSLVFASLAKTVTLHDLISWWFMPVNIGITFLIGGVLGWMVAKVLRISRKLEGLVIASSSAGNLGNLLLIIIPAVCDEQGSPFGDSKICNAHALSYVSLSMALGGFYIWTHTYSIMKKVSDDREQEAQFCSSSSLLLPDEAQQQQTMVPLLSNRSYNDNMVHCFGKIKETLHHIVEELMAPPTLAAILGFVVGVIPWLKSLIIGSTAPLRVIQDSITLLGAGTVPCCTLILGGNLTKGIRKSTVKPTTILGIILARYVLLPIAGIGVVRAASMLGFLPKDPLFHYVLLIQFALPPAMAIGTMAQLFDASQEECSVIFLWTYLVAAPALTIWSTIFMYTLS